MGAGGTATWIINKTEFENIMLINPGSDIMRNFNDYVKPIFNKILLNIQENQKLSSLRDLLLPKLMSGEIVI